MSEPRMPAQRNGDVGGRPSSPARPLDVLQVLCDSEVPPTADNVAASTGIGRATAYRLLTQLEREGWVLGQGRPRTYTASLHFIAIALAALSHNHARVAMLPHAIDLARSTGRLCTCAFYEDGEVIYTDVVEVVGARVMPNVKGQRAAAVSSASGKVLLAHQPQAEIDRILSRPIRRMTEFTKTDPEEVRRDLERARQLGYGMTDREYTPVIGGISCPVFDASGHVVGAMGIQIRVPARQEYVDDVLPLVRHHAGIASMELGYRGGQSSVVS